MLAIFFRDKGTVNSYIKNKNKTQIKKYKFRDAEKAKLAKKHKIHLVVLHNTKKKNLEEELRNLLREFYKYTYNGKAYRTFEDLKKDLGLPENANSDDHKDKLM